MLSFVVAGRSVVNQKGSRCVYVHTTFNDVYYICKHNGDVYSFLSTKILVLSLKKTNSFGIRENHTLHVNYT